MSSIVQTLREWDYDLNQQAPDAHVSMLVGIYVGLLLGTRRADFAAELRAEIEGDLGDALGIPPEALEEQFRALVERPR